jgi:hypothetical protein
LGPRCREIACLQGCSCGVGATGSACHAGGRGFESLQPLSKGLHLQAFFACQSACASASGRTDSGLAAGRSSAVPRKTLGLQADSGSSEPKSFCGPAEGRVFGLLRPLARLVLQRHDPADSARRRDTSGRGPWGPVRFQSGNREVNPRPARDPASHGPQSREFSQQDGVRGSGAVPSPGACAAAGTRVIAEGVAFHRRAGVCART